VRQCIEQQFGDLLVRQSMVDVLPVAAPRDDVFRA